MITAVQRASVAWACVLASLVSSSLAAPALAQPTDAHPTVVWTAGDPPLAGRAELWARRIERALERDGARVTIEAESWAYAPPGFAAARLEEVASIELLLFLARNRASELDERGALAALVEAERRGEAVVAIAGGAAWYAEVEVQIAIAAFQLGERGLARAALERAASIDPRRLIRPAEAPPELVDLARRAVLSARAAPVSSFEVRVSSGVRDARVFVDDEAVGAAPARVEIGAGLHALRVEASGHRPWAGLLRVLPGTREPIEVTLAVEPAVELARSLGAAVRALELSRVPALLGALAEHGVVLDHLVLTAVGEGAFDRALVIGCDPEACRVAQRLEGDVPARREHLDAGEDEPLGAALAWLEEVPDLGPIDTGGTATIPLWEEPWPWVVVGGLALGIAVGVTASVVVDGESARRRIDVVFQQP